MMYIVKHRINTLDDVNSLPANVGIETDIRSWSDSLVLHHEPFSAGPKLEELLAQAKVRENLCILNVKEDGHEENVLRICDELGVRNFFFLDSQIPTIYRLHKQGYTCFAARYSHLEPVSYVVNFKSICDWVWVDCFPEFMPAKQDLEVLQQEGFRLCIASPELQPKNTREVSDYLEIQAILRDNVDAVCTKQPIVWRSGSEKI